MKNLIITKEGVKRTFIAKDIEVREDHLIFHDCDTGEDVAMHPDSYDELTITHRPDAIYHGVMFDRDDRKFKAYSYKEKNEDLYDYHDVVVINNHFDNLDDAELLARAYNNVMI